MLLLVTISIYCIVCSVTKLYLVLRLIDTYMDTFFGMMDTYMDT